MTQNGSLGEDTKTADSLYCFVISVDKVDENVICQVCDGKQLLQVSAKLSMCKEIKENDFVVLTDPITFFGMIALKNKSVISKIDKPKIRERIVELIKSSNSLKEQIRVFNPTFCEELK